MHTMDIWVINKRVLRKFLASNFAFSDTEDNTSGPLNRWGIANLPVLRTLLAIHHKSQEPSFCEVIHFFVLIAYASLVASRTLLEQFLACPNFPFGSEDLFCWYKQTKWFIWTVATKKQLKTMEMSDPWLDTYNAGYIHWFHPELTNKIH